MHLGWDVGKQSRCRRHVAYCCRTYVSGSSADCWVYRCTAPRPVPQHFRPAVQHQHPVEVIRAVGSKCILMLLLPVCVCDDVCCVSSPALRQLHVRLTMRIAPGVGHMSRCCVCGQHLRWHSMSKLRTHVSVFTPPPTPHTCWRQILQSGLLGL